MKQSNKFDGFTFLRIHAKGWIGMKNWKSRVGAAIGSTAVATAVVLGGSVGAADSASASTSYPMADVAVGMSARLHPDTADADYLGVVGNPYGGTVVIGGGQYQPSSMKCWVDGQYALGTNRWFLVYVTIADSNAEPTWVRNVWAYVNAAGVINQPRVGHC